MELPKVPRENTLKQPEWESLSQPGDKFQLAASELHFNTSSKHFLPTLDF